MPPIPRAHLSRADDHAGIGVVDDDSRTIVVAVDSVVEVSDKDGSIIITFVPVTAAGIAMARQVRHHTPFFLSKCKFTPTPLTFVSRRSVCARPSPLLRVLHLTDNRLDIRIYIWKTSPE
jgi:hypothetical protein